ncbi:type I-E CRISPR-associated protein Cse1/CasA [Nocardia sp. NPDC088792]|uniref:type I-E CRISPR-associated protein Cse1/CasA n=1 Tax=Nocardia sp. NPDC088792 TaxID=3364332 RepID=UPI003829A02B
MTFDLRVEPAIPVFVPGNGPGRGADIKTIGFRELFVSAHEYRDLAIAIPPTAAGMLRVLYTIAARITGIDKAHSRTEFEALRLAVAKEGMFAPTNVDEYFWRTDLDNRWNLFDSAWPWLQDPRLAEQADRKSVNALDPTRPGDNSPIWWQHTWKDNAPPLSPQEAMYWLLAHHWYGSGGSGGTRRVCGKGDQYMSAGPLRGALSFYPLGDNLFQTLIAGVPSPATAHRTGPDAAPWEAGDHLDPLSQPDEATWPAGLLTGQSRHAMLLVPDLTGSRVEGCYLTWALKRKHPPLKDPYTIQDRRKDLWQPRSADASRAVWRDVDALLADEADHRRPQVWTDTQTLPDSWQSTLRLRVHGWDQDRQSVDRMMFTATTPELLQWSYENDPEAADGAAGLHTAAEDIHGVMCSALRTAYRKLGTGSAGKPGKEVPWVAPAETYYWSAAETLFWQRLEQRQFDQSYRDYLPLALEAVDAVTRHVAHHPPVAREVAEAVRFLRRFVAKKNPRVKKEED